MARGISLSGEKELLKMLKELAPKEMKKAVRQASRVTAKAVLQDAKSMVPVDTGLLEESLAVRVATKLGRNRIGHRVVTKPVWDDQDAFYGHFIEFGTVKMEADPFMRPALWGNEDEMKRVFTQELRAAVSVLQRQARTNAPKVK